MTRVFLVEWLGVVAYVEADSRSRAGAVAMRCARDAGYWRPGASLRGLRVRVATYVPPDEPVMRGHAR